MGAREEEEDSFTKCPAASRLMAVRLGGELFCCCSALPDAAAALPAFALLLLPPPLLPSFSNLR